MLGFKEETAVIAAGPLALCSCMVLLGVEEHILLVADNLVQHG